MVVVLFSIVLARVERIGDFTAELDGAKADDESLAYAQDVLEQFPTVARPRFESGG